MQDKHTSNKLSFEVHHMYQVNRDLGVRSTYDEEQHQYSKWVIH